MPAVATEKWSGKSKGKGRSGDEATRIWDVVGAADEDDALAATGVANQDDPYALGSPMLCRFVNAIRDGSNNSHVVTAQYAIPSTGTWVTPGNTTDPLLEPPTILWNTVLLTDKFDRTTAGHPVLNASGNPYSPELTRTWIYKTLKITKNKSFYDYAALTPFENTVNSAPISATEPNGHVNTWAAETWKCVSIEPAGAYRSNATYIPVCCSFEIWDLNFESGIPTTMPHQARVLQQGRMSWYNDAGTVRPGHICTKNGDIVQEDVRLLSNGTPKDLQYYVRDGSNIAAPTSNPNAATIQSYVTVEVATGATFFVHRRYKTANFATLKSLMGF